MEVAEAINAIEDMLFGISIILMILTGALVAMAGLMLCTFVVLLKGVNQHIQALQGIYDLLKANRPDSSSG